MLLDSAVLINTISGVILHCGARALAWVEMNLELCDGLVLGDQGERIATEEDGVEREGRDVAERHLLYVLSQHATWRLQGWKVDVL